MTDRTRLQDAYPHPRLEQTRARKATTATTARKVAKCVLSIALVATLSTGLQGCVGVVLGGAAIGAVAATDRRTVGAQADDAAITVKAEARTPGLIGEAGHVNIASFNRKVLLTGEVRDEATKQAVEREVAGIQGVQGIINELVVTERSNYTSRGNDTLITTKVKASFVDTRELAANAIKVVTEHGSVYLMGRVTQREGERAAEVARGVAGVDRVVKVFDYISEDDLREIDKRS